MKRLLPHSALAATLLAAALLASSAGGAVAGALITSAQIKDGTITSADIRNKTVKRTDLAPATISSLGGPSPVAGYVLVQEVSDFVSPSALAAVTAECPPGKTALSAGAYWNNTYVAPQTFPVDAGASRTSWTAGGVNESGSQDRIRLTLVCAAAG